ncbi:MAG TPA: hypothetical protein VLL06_08905 [Nitrospiraceae bacterium]|nr:hypothetical protein [Nitrospiraceae bacterium]
MDETTSNHRALEPEPSEYEMPKPCNPHSTTDQQQEQSDQPNRKGILKNPKYVLNGSIALFAFILIVASIILYLLRSTHQTAERARVTVQKATIVGPLIANNVPRAKILFQNSGRSPALTTKIRLLMTVWTSNKLPDWEMPPILTTDVESVGVIGPGSVVSQDLYLMTPLSEEQGVHLERKDWFIVTLGVVSYIDIFGNPHETKLCLIWRDPSTESLSLCEKWNEAN